MSGVGMLPVAKFRLEVEPLNLGEGVKAVGLELIEAATREPVQHAEAARVWSRVLVALAATESWALDFFSHLDRVKDYCTTHEIAFRDAGKRSMVVTPPADTDELEDLLERFEGETFGARAGGELPEADADLEGDLSSRGVDGYHHAYSGYYFCAVCDFQDGFLTLLTDKLWASEVIRRVKPVLTELGVEVYLPQ